MFLSQYNLLHLNVFQINSIYWLLQNTNFKISFGVKEIFIPKRLSEVRISHDINVINFDEIKDTCNINYIVI